MAWDAMKSLPAASRSKREQRALGASQLGSRMSSEREPHTRGTRRPPPEPSAAAAGVLVAMARGEREERKW